MSDPYFASPLMVTHKRPSRRNAVLCTGCDSKWIMMDETDRITTSIRGFIGRYTRQDVNGPNLHIVLTIPVTSHIYLCSRYPARFGLSDERHSKGADVPRLIGANAFFSATTPPSFASRLRLLNHHVRLLGEWRIG